VRLMIIQIGLALPDQTTASIDRLRSNRYNDSKPIIRGRVAAGRLGASNCSNTTIALVPLNLVERWRSVWLAARGGYWIRKAWQLDQRMTPERLDLDDTEVSTVTTVQ
jgi:hypothetical protein